MLQMKVVLRPGGGGADPADEVSEVKPTGGSTDPKTFLAMRARQKRVQARVRLVKRLVLGCLAVGIGAGWFSYRGPTTAATVAATAATSTAIAQAPQPLASQVASPTLPAGGSSAPAFATLEEAVATLDEGAAAEAKAAASAALGASCEEAFDAHRWRAAIASCEGVFAAAPEAGVALRIAHSYFASGLPTPAGTWAQKAVELGTEDADAFVLIGHAERQAGNPQSAIRAYQRYLEWSPRGWHARTVRAALRQLKAKVVSQRAPERAVDRGVPAGRL